MYRALKHPYVDLRKMKNELRKDDHVLKIISRYLSGAVDFVIPIFAPVFVAVAAVVLIPLYLAKVLGRRP